MLGLCLRIYGSDFEIYNFLLTWLNLFASQKFPFQKHKLKKKCVVSRGNKICYVKTFLNKDVKEIFSCFVVFFFFIFWFVNYTCLLLSPKYIFFVGFLCCMWKWTMLFLKFSNKSWIRKSRYKNFLLIQAWPNLLVPHFTLCLCY